MKTHHSLSPLLGVALLAVANLTTHAQTWTTVFDSSSAGIAGVCGDIGTDAAGKVVYAAGRYIADDGSSVAAVQRSSDGGNSWELMDQYAESGLNYAHNRAFAADPITGHLFAGGNLNNLARRHHDFNTLWFIREWNPVTGTWSTADDYSALVNDVGEASCADILVTPSGDVYATGGGGPGWVVRKRAANASTFTTVYPDSTGQTAGGSSDMAYHPTHGVFVVGDANGIWTVRRSASGEPEHLEYGGLLLHPTRMDRRKRQVHFGDAVKDPRRGLGLQISSRKPLDRPQQLRWRRDLVHHRRLRAHGRHRGPGDRSRRLHQSLGLRVGSRRRRRHPMDRSQRHGRDQASETGEEVSDGRDHDVDDH